MAKRRKRSKALKAFAVTGRTTKGRFRKGAVLPKVLGKRGRRVAVGKGKR